MTHYDILPDEQKTLLPKLNPTLRLGYVLYGGTAIALQLGHRESVDFDFFTDKKLDENLLNQAMPVLKTGTTTQREPETWTMIVRPEGAERDVKVSFFGGLGFGRVGKPVVTEGKEIIMASLDDLMGHKLKVLLQRVEAKDYLDIAALLKNGQTLERGLGAAEAMFSNFPAAEALRTLTYFKGGDLERIGANDREILIRSVNQVGHTIEMPVISRNLGVQPPQGGGGMPPMGYGIE